MSFNQSNISALTNNVFGDMQASQKVDFNQASSVSVGSSSDAEQFAKTLAKYNAREASPVANVSSADNSNSLGTKVMNNIAEMSSRLAEANKRITTLIEKATVSGDPQITLNAMMELSNYNQQAQMVTKTVAKAATGLETLTRLQ